MASELKATAKVPPLPMVLSTLRMLVMDVLLLVTGYAENAPIAAEIWARPWN